jgi:hypothetical protein
MSISVCGDGETTSFSVDLSALPFGIDFGGNFPVEVAVPEFDFEDLSATALIAITHGRPILTITFNSAPPNAPTIKGENVFGIFVLFGYAG